MRGAARGRQDQCAMPVKGALLGSALLLSQAVAFSPPACLPGVSGSAPRSCDTVRYASKGRSVANEPLGGVRSQMDKIEASAVQRMTKGYDKLCKNCPTRLQPRVDTLTEMIMGLPTSERDELLKVVAQRMEALETAGDEQVQGVRTPKEVYNFQLTGQVGAGAGMTPAPSVRGDGEQFGKMMEKGKMKDKMKKDKMKDCKMQDGGEKMRRKLIEKMEKYRGKIDKNEMKLARAERMLAVSEALVAEGAQAQIPQDAVDATNPKIAMDIDELRMMSREQLEVKRLKYVEKKAKYQRKLAESRMDLGMAEKELADLAQSAERAGAC